MAKNQAEIVVTARAEGSQELERLAKDLDGIAQSGSDAAPEAARLAEELRKLGQPGAAVAPFAALKKESADLKAALETARAATSSMGRELATAEQPTAKMRREFDQSRKVLEQLEQRYQGNARQLNALRTTLTQAGVSTSSMASESRRLDASLTQVQQEARALSARQGELAVKQKAAAASARDQAAANVENSKAMDMAADAVRGGLAAVAGTLTAGAAFDAMLSMESLSLQLEAVAGSSKSAAKEMEYVKSVSKRLGSSVLDTGKAWSDFMSAARGSAVEGEQARRIFEVTTGTLLRQGKSMADVSGLMLAFTQVLGNGVLKLEELNQVSDRFPAASKLIADSLGISIEELKRLATEGKIAADVGLRAFADGAEREFGRVEKKVDSLGAGWQRLKNSIFGTAGEQGNSFIGEALTAELEGVADDVDRLNKSIAEIKPGYDAVKKATSDQSIANNFSGISLEIARTVKAVQVFATTGNLLDAWKSRSGVVAKSVQDDADKTAKAQNKVTQANADTGQSLVKLDLDFSNAKKAQEDSAKNSERGAKAKLDEAKAALELAKATQDKTAIQRAELVVATAAADLERVRLESKEKELVLAERELSLMLRKLAERPKASQAEREAVNNQREKVDAISAEVPAQKAVAIAADATAAAATRAADATLSAFKALGITSQAEAKKAADEAATAFAQVEKAAQSGAATVTDVQKAFLAYAQKVIATGDATAIAVLSTRAAVLGVGDEFNKLAGTASSAGAASSASLQGVGSSAKQTAADVASIAASAKIMADEVEASNLRMAGSFTSAAQRGRMAFSESAAAMEAYNAEWQKYVDSADKSEAKYYNAIHRGEDAARAVLEVERERTAQAARKAAEEERIRPIIEQQNVAISEAVRKYDQMQVSASSVMLSADDAARSMGLLAGSNVSQLEASIERVNGKIQRLRDEAKSATDQLEGMARAAQDEIDRASGNVEAIEARRKAEELRRIDELAAKGADAAAVARAKAAAEAASAQRMAEAKRAKDEAAQRAGEAKAKTVQASQGAASAASQSSGGYTVDPNQERFNQPAKTVRIQLDLPHGATSSFNMASESDAEGLISALESLKKRGAY